MSQRRDPVAEARDAVAVLRRGRPLIGAAVLVTTLAALLSTALRPGGYTAVSRLILTPSSLEIATDGDSQGSEASPLADVALETQAEIAHGPIVAAHVVRRLKLATTPELLAEQVGAVATATDVLEITASAPDPRQAATLANAFGEEYLRYRRQWAVTAMRDAVRQLEAERASLQRRLRDADRRIALLPVGDAAALGGTGGAPAGGQDRQGQVEQLRAERGQLLADIGALSARIDTLTVASATPTGGAIFERAATAAPPSSPLKAGAVGVVLGLVLGAGLAWVRERVHRPIGTRDDAARVTGLRVLGDVPRRRRWRSGRPARWAGRPDLAVADGYRMLAFRLGARGLGTTIRRVAVVAPLPGEEGVPAAAAHLAAACATAGWRTLAIAADPYGPDLTGHLGLPEGGPGLLEVLRGELALADALHWVEPPGLAVLASGRHLDGHVARVGGERFAKVLTQAGALADVVVVGSPPVLAGSDAVAVTAEADATLLVVRAGVSRTATVRRAVEALAQAGMRPLGVLLDGADPSDDSLGTPPTPEEWAGVSRSGAAARAGTGARPKRSPAALPARRLAEEEIPPDGDEGRVPDGGAGPGGAIPVPQRARDRRGREPP